MSTHENGNAYLGQEMFSATFPTRDRSDIFRVSLASATGAGCLLSVSRLHVLTGTWGTMELPTISHGPTGGHSYTPSTRSLYWYRYTIIVNSPESAYVSHSLAPHGTDTIFWLVRVAVYWTLPAATVAALSILHKKCMITAENLVGYLQVSSRVSAPTR